MCILYSLIDKHHRIENYAMPREAGEEETSDTKYTMPESDFMKLTCPVHVGLCIVGMCCLKKRCDILLKKHLCCKKGRAQ